MFGDRIYALDFGQRRADARGGDVGGYQDPRVRAEEVVEDHAVARVRRKAVRAAGGVEEVWSAKEDVAARLAKAIGAATTDDNRAELGKKRGGRKLALDIRKKSSPPQRDDRAATPCTGATVAGARCDNEADRDRAVRWHAAGRPFFVVTRRREAGSRIGLGFCTTDERLLNCGRAVWRPTPTLVS